MQEYNYKYADNDTYIVNSYKGDESHIIVPNTYYGKDVSVIYDSLFAGHDEIEFINIPETIIYIGGHVFDGCIHLHTIDLPDSLLDIAQYAFTRSGITTITIPDNVKRIVPYTFYECTQLETIYLGKHTVQIDGHAFASCSSLKDLYISRDTILSTQTFIDCPNINIHYY